MTDDSVAQLRRELRRFAYASVDPALQLQIVRLMSVVADGNISSQQVREATVTTQRAVERAAKRGSTTLGRPLQVNRGRPRLEADDDYLNLFRSLFESVGDPPLLLVSKAPAKAIARHCAEQGVVASDAAIRAHIHRAGIRMYHRRPSADQLNERRRIEKIKHAIAQTPTRLHTAVFDESTDSGATWKPCSGRQVNRRELTEWATEWIRRTCLSADVVACESAIDFQENGIVSPRNRLGPEHELIWIAMPSAPHFWGPARQLPHIGFIRLGSRLVRLTLCEPRPINMAHFGLERRIADLPGQ